MRHQRTERRQINVRIDDELADWLEEEADRRAVSKTFLVEAALRQLRHQRQQVAR